MRKCKGQCPYYWPKTLNDNNIKECKNCSNVISYKGDTCPCCGENLKNSHISQAKNLDELQRKEDRLLIEMGYAKDESDDTPKVPTVETTPPVLPDTHGEELSQELPDAPEPEPETPKDEKKGSENNSKKSNNNKNQSKKD